MGIMEWLSILVALVTGAATGGVTVGLMRGRLSSIEGRLTSIERRLADAHRRIDNVLEQRTKHDEY